MPNAPTRPDHDPRFALRTRALNPVEPRNAPVMLWMRTALRAHENPALELALCMARHLGTTVWVYLGLSERYRYASDRHHRFILEGMRDVVRQLAERGIAVAVHVERPDHRGPVLEQLAREAGLVITEEMPVAPLRLWTRGLADRVETAVWTVDTATVVPMRFVGKGIDRAFQYRRHIQHVIDTHLEPHPPEAVSASSLPALPFAPVDLENTDLDALIASCDIDHTVPPVPDTVGGSTAGYARWRAFLGSKLDRYAADRNDPLRHGVSRMSAYLHYGMVAPTRIAREARQHGTKGAEKLVDELIVWRELAYTWCLYAREHETLEALPSWARSSLLAHADDPRPTQPTLEQLHLGQTGELLWDVAQQSLLRHGELHNNVRMTWGKALLHWSPDPQTALDRLVDLNHRYALDGRDPASYGGLLWCMGLFDRPFPEQPIWGQVRSRSVSRHAKRLDVSAWAAAIQRPRALTVGIVGAGLSGSFLARLLHSHGVQVTVFDKGRGPSGRLAARRTEHGRLPHGAHMLHIDDRHLQRWVQGWIEAGVVEAVPGGVRSWPTKTLLKHLQRNLVVRYGQRVDRVAPGEIHIGDQVHRFDRVVVTAPAPQAVELLGGHPHAALMTQVQLEPCWAGLFTFERPQQPSSTPPQLASIAGDGRGWAVHASPAWSREHLERDADEVAGMLASMLPEAGFDAPDTASAHRWRYARVTQPLDETCLYDGAVGVCGDAFGGRADGALRSAAALAGRILA